MSSRLNFLRAFMDAAASVDSTKSVSEPTESAYQTCSGSAGPESSGIGTSKTGGRGRARLLAAFADMQKTQQSTVEEPLPANPIIAGRGRFLKRMIEMANEQKRVEPEKTDTVAAAQENIEKLTLEDDKKQTPLPEKKYAPSVSSEPTEPVVRTGTSGTSTTLLCNFMELRCDPNRGIFLYTVDYLPTVDSKSERYRCLENNAHIFGKTYSFDGIMLLLPQELPDKLMVINTKRPHDGSPLQMTVTFRAKKRMSENVMFYNKLFRRIMGILELTEMGRKHFDPTQVRIVPQHKLEVWPGYVTAVNEFEGGLMLNLDVTHRVLSQTTVYEHIRMTSVVSPGKFRENVLKSLLGLIVITRYNKKTYRIDDVCFDANPMCTFRYGERDVTYVEYYKEQYGIEIMDLNQPMLLHRTERRISGMAKPQEMLMFLVPEICHLTGLTDLMRSDFKVMRDIAMYTRVTPNQRIAAMEQFCKNVNANEAARVLLSSWGLELNTKANSVVGRTLPTEKITFGKNGLVDAGPNADFNIQITNNHMLDVVHIRSWLLVYTGRDGKIAKDFMDGVNRNCRLIGMEISRPQIEVLAQDSTAQYVQTLRACVRPETQIVVIIFPTSRDDRYATVKRVCCTEIPVPTQVINARTLSNDRRVRSIVLKILLQMNCKLGGSLWGVNIPLNDTMICGIDTYHETKNISKTVAAFVGSLDAGFTHWYSRATIQSNKEELMNGLCLSFERMLHAYKRRNCQLPSRVIIFRDGVSDTQMIMCEQYELPQLLAACELVESGYAPKITFLIVQKRIITRMFDVNRTDEKYGNPPPGTLLDHTVTRRYLYDFFLISQSVRQGTVSPTHYIVLRDDSSFAPDILQRLAYKMCYMYYNWPGTVRVPACCQYAHKLAYLVGQSLKRMPADSLCDKLFYL